MSDNRDRIIPLVRRMPRSVGLGHRIWALRENGVDWSAELLDRGPMVGVKALIFKSGALIVSHRCDTRLAAVKWAGMKRAELRKSGFLSPGSLRNEP